MKIKIAVVGSRDFVDYELLEHTLDDYIITDARTIFSNCVIVSGGARGADGLSERYAIERKMASIVHEADWGRYGRSAGMKRNKDIVADADILFAFWDGKSKGTKNSIDLAKKKGIRVEVLGFEIETS